MGSITKGNCKFRASGDYLFHVMMFKQARVVMVKSMAYQLADANAALGKLGFEATHI